MERDLSVKLGAETMIKNGFSYTSHNGGSIVVFQSSDKRVFLSCFSGNCLYSSDLYSAKLNLNDLENITKLLPSEVDKISSQRKTTLKWNSNGELTAFDMTRVLSLLSPPELKMCDLSCDVKEVS